MSFNFASVRWGMSKKQDGSMKLLSGGILDQAAVNNRKKFFRELGIETENTVSASLVHGTKVAVVTTNDRGRLIPETDGLITNQANLFLTITVADCVPIYFFDPKKQAVGLAHSGWKGTAQNIAAAMVNALCEQYHSSPNDIHAFIGVHIQTHHFEAKEDVAQQFQNYSPWISKKDDRFLIDLGAVIQKQLTDAGLLIKNIETDPVCTYCDIKNYFSFRRDKPMKLEAMLAYIGLCG